MTLSLSRAAAVIAAGALLIPAAAQAKPGNGKGLALGHEKNGVPAPHVVAAPAELPAVEQPADVAATEIVAPGETVAAPVRKSGPAASRGKGRAKPKTFVFRG